ncbi:MAG: AAA family ATPase [Pseudomonadota bacterium]
MNRSRRSPSSAAQAQVERQAALVKSLAALLAADGAPVRLIETHISWVIVHPVFSYKLKKALRTAFLDYLTLPARQYYCEEEVRLNRRLAPRLYLDVACITGTHERPVLDGAGPVLDYAVRMRTFDQGALWQDRLERGVLGAGEAASLGRLLARFHHDVPRAPQEQAWGTRVRVIARTKADLAEVGALLADPEQCVALAQLGSWIGAQHRRMARSFDARKHAGWVREGHGDLHCGNLLTIDGQVQAFDGIEFAPEMRWIDVMHDIAFPWMDLRSRGRADLASRFLNVYLQGTGDYEGLAVLAYYCVQRALVRCKANLLSSGQAGTPGARAATIAEAWRYLSFARDCTSGGAAGLIITHGLSGSGKSFACDALVEPLGALQIRSDVERKRLRGLPATQAARAAPGQGIYDARAGSATYRRLARAARQALVAGLVVLVDAAFLSYQQRELFRSLARELGLPFVILDVRAPLPALRARLATRARAGSDASDADLVVLAHQLRVQDELRSDETDRVVVVRTGDDAGDCPLQELAARVKVFL